MKNWEVEASFKTKLADWRTIDQDNYTFAMNGGPPQTGDHMLKVGTYNAIIAPNEYYSPAKSDFSSSHKTFKVCSTNDVYLVFDHVITPELENDANVRMGGARGLQWPTGCFISLEALGSHEERLCWFQRVWIPPVQHKHTRLISQQQRRKDHSKVTWRLDRHPRCDGRYRKRRLEGAKARNVV